MLGMMDTGSSDFVTNDELFYSPEHNIVAGLPAALRIKRCTLDRYPWLAEHMNWEPYLKADLSGRNQIDYSNLDPLEVVGTVRPHSICAALNINMAPVTPATLTKAYFLTSTDSPVLTTIEELDTKSKHRLLLLNVQQYASENQPMWNDGIIVNQNEQSEEMAERVLMRSLSYHHQSLPFDPSILA